MYVVDLVLRDRVRDDLLIVTKRRGAPQVIKILFYCDEKKARRGHRWLVNKVEERDPFCLVRQSSQMVAKRKKQQIANNGGEEGVRA